MVPLTTGSSNSSVDNIQKLSQFAGAASSVFSNITMGPLWMNINFYLFYNSVIPPNSPVPRLQGLTQNYGGYMSTIPTSTSVAPYSFQLCFLSGNISVCNGSLKKYLKPAIPSYDVVVQHEEWRNFVAGGIPQRCFGNGYCACARACHPTPYCIQVKWPLFQADELQIPTEVIEALLDVHKWFNNQTFGLVFRNIT